MGQHMDTAWSHQWHHGGRGKPMGPSREGRGWQRKREPCRETEYITQEKSQINHQQKGGHGRLMLPTQLPGALLVPREGGSRKC